jgi:protocatechuate 3,4-dioxygenase alpha subunit
MSSSHRQTPSQTVGPFFGVGLTRPDASHHVLATDRTIGERIRIQGTVFDGAGHGVVDALVEIWQANAHGRYRHPLDTGPAPIDPSFHGFGRCPTDATGSFAFDTVKPGAIQSGGAKPHAPHVNVIVFSRGMLVHAFTRMYFSDDDFENDPVLSLVDRDRRATLVGSRTTDAAGLVVYRWDIHLQGEHETVFFDA